MFVNTRHHFDAQDATGNNDAERAEQRTRRNSQKSELKALRLTYLRCRGLLPGGVEPILTIQRGLKLTAGRISDNWPRCRRQASIWHVRAALFTSPCSFLFAKVFSVRVLTRCRILDPQVSVPFFLATVQFFTCTHLVGSGCPYLLPAAEREPESEGCVIQAATRRKD